MDQKCRIVRVRREFLSRLQNVVYERAALTAAMQRPMPIRYDDLPSLNQYTEAVVSLEGRLRSLLQEQLEAYRLMQYGIREVLPTPTPHHCLSTEPVMGPWLQAHACGLTCG
jgi:hypothetical protein